MKYTTLGRTGVTVSRLCLGCMSYGSSSWRPWILDGEEAARPFFRAAAEAGINFFDTADGYSLGRSEEITGKMLKEFTRREEVVLATKVFFPMGKGPNTKGLSKKHVVEGCEASLRRLGVDTIDLYQIHRFDPETPLEETLAAMDLLVAAGEGPLHRGQLRPGLEADEGARTRRPPRLPALRLDAEPLQPRLPRGGARDAATLRRGGDRRHPLVAPRARPPRRDAARAPTTGPRPRAPRATTTPGSSTTTPRTPT